jgi:hypothetical protein
MIRLYGNVTEIKEKWDRLTWVRTWDSGNDEERESFHKLSSGPGVLQDLWYVCDSVEISLILSLSSLISQESHSLACLLVLNLFLIPIHYDSISAPTIWSFGIQNT